MVWGVRVTLDRFLPDEPATDYALAVVDADVPQPLVDILDELFAEQSIDVEQRSETADRDRVVLLADGEMAASSPLSALSETILTVNSDLYVTGTRSPDDLDLPAVLAELTDVPFSLRGYPESHKEKLLLITISRYIEGLALDRDDGRLRASFQQLSRIRDELGTYRVYERLASSAVETHVYGRPDWIPARDLAVVTHAGTGDDFRRSWFVLHRAGDASAAALLAIETDAGQWDGFWTFEPDRVAAIERYIERSL